MTQHILMEFDKSGAEWVVVAYASGDGQMIDVVKGDESPHSKTGMLISGAPIELVEMENKLVEHHTDPDTIRTIRSESLAALLEGDYFLPRSMSIRQAGKSPIMVLTTEWVIDGLRWKMRWRNGMQKELSISISTAPTQEYPFGGRQSDNNSETIEL